VTTTVILERASAYRRGLTPVLEAAGFTVVPDAPDSGRRVVLAPLRSPADCAILERLAGDEEAVVVALVADDGADGIAHALQHGACGVAPWDADPEEIARVAAAALEGFVMAPVRAATALARRGPDWHRERPPLDATEPAWLVGLSKGASVVQLAERFGYSERAMFRRLAEVYGRLGASNRAEALVAAERLGLLDPT
jgi:DNA-binding NarL/FixJ family response regulator